MGSSTLLIGELARTTGLAAPTIRYYEDIGLLKKPSRRASGYRTYSPQTIDELLFIKKAQALGFTLDEIAQILELSRSGQRPCERVLALSRKHLDTLDERIRHLRRFRTYLANEICKWDRRDAAVTREGLCQFISDADLGVDAPLHGRRTRDGRALRDRLRAR